MSLLSCAGSAGSAGSDTSACNAGEAQCACLADGACQFGLVCASNLCVPVPVPGPDAGPPDAHSTPDAAPKHDLPIQSGDSGPTPDAAPDAAPDTPPDAPRDARSADAAIPRPGAQQPAGTSAQEITNFVIYGEFRRPGWLPDVPAPRAPKAISPHARVRVWFNEAAVAAHRSGFGGRDSLQPYGLGTVVVKEFFNSESQPRGWTLLWKHLPGSDEPGNWLAFCLGPQDSCVQDSNASETVPVLGTLAALPECHGCHHKDAKQRTGLVYTLAPGSP